MTKTIPVVHMIFYSHIAIQFEDCVDCLKVIYPQFDFVVLFDHSQGHAKAKFANGLDAYSMNKARIKGLCIEV
jgi:hypothetical protein